MRRIFLSHGFICICVSMHVQVRSSSPSHTTHTYTQNSSLYGDECVLRKTHNPAALPYGGHVYLCIAFRTPFCLCRGTFFVLSLSLSLSSVVFLFCKHRNISRLLPWSPSSSSGGSCSPQLILPIV